MKFVIQRVTSAEVAVDHVCIGSIKRGFLVLAGIGNQDNEMIADKMIKKLLGLRIFEDSDGKTNLDLKSV